jgi:hypothetical protein
LLGPRLATGADIEAMGIERGHRTLVVTRKGGKVVTIPLAPRTARAIDLAIGERCAGPAFLATDGRRLDRHGAARIVRQVARRAGIAKAIGPHTLRHAFITAAPVSTRVFHCGMCSVPHRTGWFCAGLLRVEPATAGSRTGAVVPELLLIAGTGLRLHCSRRGSLGDTEGSHWVGAGPLLTTAR